MDATSAEPSVAEEPDAKRVFAGVTEAEVAEVAFAEYVKLEAGTDADIAVTDIVDDDVDRSLVEHAFFCLSSGTLESCNCSQVCQEHANMISHPQFLPHSKRYFGGVSASLEAAAPVEPVKENALFVLIRCAMHLSQPELQMSTANLERLHNFAVATAYVQAAGLQEGESSGSVWPLVLAMMYFCTTVSQVLAIVTAVLAKAVLRHRCVDFLYGVLSLLKALERRPNIRPVHAYNLHYALHCILLQPENVSRMTSEQAHIVKDKPGPGDVWTISAFAGTGKTHTLQQFLARHASKDYKILYVSFNKAIREEAEARSSRLPNKAFVTCRTLHSLAKQRRSPVSIPDNCRRASFQAATKVSTPGEAGIIITFLDNFMSSTEAMPNDMHIPEDREYLTNRDGLDILSQCALANMGAHTMMMPAGTILALGLQLWTLLLDPGRAVKELPNCTMGNNDVSTLHFDLAMKLYQLDQRDMPTMHRGYQCIIVDEAQDLTEAQMDCIMQQRAHCGIVLAGDPHQAIYQFRGVLTSTFLRVPATTAFHLTQSFRFGPQIAYISELILKSNPGISSGKVLVGKPPPMDGSDSVDGILARTDKVHVLTRINLTVLDRLFRFLMHPEHRLPVGTKVFADMDKISTKFRALREIFKLRQRMTTGPQAHRRIAQARYAHLRAAAQGFYEDSLKFEIVERYGAIPNFDRMLTVAAWKPHLHGIENTADVSVVTIFHAKGKTLNHVVLAEDVLHRPAMCSYSEEMLNIAYVACSRASRSLTLNDNVINLIEEIDRRCQVVRDSDVHLDGNVVDGVLQSQAGMFNVCSRHAQSSHPRLYAIDQRYAHSTLDPWSPVKADCSVRPVPEGYCVFCISLRQHNMGCQWTDSETV